MRIDDLTIRQAKELARLFSADKVKIPTEEYVPVFKNPVVAQFIGRFVFVCNLQIIGNYCHLTEVRNVRYWEVRENGLGDLAVNGKKEGDKIDKWPDQIIPLDKLGPVMDANSEHWS